MLLAGKDVLLVFVRHPEPGRTKTRLIPARGPEGAADTYRRITERVVDTVKNTARPDLVARLRKGSLSYASLAR